MSASELLVGMIFVLALLAMFIHPAFGVSALFTLGAFAAMPRE